MGFINSSQGAITHALLYESLGSSLDSVLELALNLEHIKQLFVVLCPNNEFNQSTLYKLYKAADREQRAGAFKAELIESEFESLLKDNHPDYKNNWLNYLETIRPKALAGDRLIFELEWRGASPSAAFMGEAGERFKATDAVMLLSPIGDFVIPVVVNALTHTVTLGDSHKDIIEQLLVKHGFKIEPAPQPFIKNGDLMAGNGFLFIGISSFKSYKRYILKADPSAIPTIEDFKQHLLNVYYKDEPPPAIYVIGKEEDTCSGNSSFYHLDLFLNYAGETGDGKHLFFLGQMPDEVIDLFFTPGTPAYDEMKTQQLYLKEMYDAINCLAKDRFVVQPIPLVKVGTGIFTFNNALVECVGNNRSYYLPRYEDLTTFFGAGDNVTLLTDVVLKYYRQAYDTIRLFGFNVKPIKVSHLVNQGVNQALHCTTAVLKRG